MEYRKVFLKPKKEESLKRFHPWIFSGAIAKIEGTPEEGEIVEVYTSEKQFIALGHYQIGSITIRVLSFRKEKIDYNFWRTKIEQAYAMRKTLGLAPTPQNNTFRLIHGEGDGLPGLIIDIYDHTAIIQAHSVGMHMNRKQIAEVLLEVLAPTVKYIFYKSETTLPYKADLVETSGFLTQKTTEHIGIENGLKFQVDFLKGQKTGFFIDQRENRALLEKYASNRNVLNMFCYTGGFSFYAMRGGAKLVHSLDSSAKAIELTNQNIELNFPNDDRHQSFVEDGFRFLDEMPQNKYDLIVLDPPAFAKHRKNLRNALQGYKRLNAKAIEKIKPGGILFTFSCSQVVTKEQFRTTLFSASAIAKREVRILHQLTQPADHPINIYHPEGEYLKGLVLYVE